jgi:drug/metabolite transporter (DMT)-like permease
MGKIYNDELLLKNFQTENENKKNIQLKLKEISNDNVKYDSFDKEKEKDLNLGRFYSMISCLFYSMSDITLKMTQIRIPNYNFFFMMTIRFLIFCLLGKIFIIRNSIKIKGLLNIENKSLLFIRIIASLLTMLFLKLSFYYIRFGLSVSLLMLSPIWVNFLSIYFFKEKFELKYIISCFVCLLGTYLISLGENSIETSKDNYNNFIGISFGILSSFSVGIAVTCSKTLLKAFKSYELIYIFGFYSFLISFILCFFQFQLIYETFSLFFIFISSLNGISHFYANHFSFLSFNLADMNKISYINYMQIILSLISGYCLFNDSLNLLDFIGGGIIIGFNYITTKYYK